MDASPSGNRKTTRSSALKPAVVFPSISIGTHRAQINVSNVDIYGISDTRRRVIARKFGQIGGLLSDTSDLVSLSPKRRIQPSPVDLVASSVRSRILREENYVSRFRRERQFADDRIER